MTDFSVVEAEERKRNYSPYGGGELQPQSSERAIRDQYEANTLMAYDSPPCPREPADPYNGESMVTKDFGALDPQSVVAVSLLLLFKLHRRHANSLQTRAARLTKQLTDHLQSPPASSTPDISAILAMINPQQHQQMQGQAPDQMSELQRILANLPQGTSQQQAAAQPPQSAVAPNITDILANLQPQMSATSTAAHIQPQVQAPANAGFAMPDPTNLAVILGQLGQTQHGGSGAPPLPSSSGFPQFGFPGQSFGQGQQQPHTQEHDERKRWREGEEDSGNQGRTWVKKAKGRHYTLPCKYYQMGKCQKGAACTYLHE